mgnify:CR=1 FL=1
MIVLFPLSQPATLGVVLEKLQPGTAPLWGGMSAQQMVEHLDVIVRHSASDKEIAVSSPAEMLPKLRQWLDTDKPLQRNIRNPLFNNEPCVHPDLDAAIRSLHEGIALFHETFAEAPEHTSPHPVFGYLDYEGWLRFHQKNL